MEPLPTNSNSDHQAVQTRILQRLLAMLLSRQAMWVLIVIAVIMTLPTGAVMYRASRLRDIPDIGDPFDVEAFTAIKIPDEENAYLDYVEAAEHYVTYSESSWCDSYDPEATFQAYEIVMEGGWKRSTKAVRGWLDDVRPALEIWRRGTNKPTARLLSSNIDNNWSHQSLTDDMARAATLEASRTLHEGELSESWSWCRAILRCSRHLGIHAHRDGRYSGNNIHTLGVERTMEWALDEQVDETMLLSALRDVSEIYRLTPSVLDTCKWEYIYQGHLAEQVPFEAEFSEVYFRHWLMNVDERERRIHQHILANAIAEEARYLAASPASRSAIRNNRIPSPVRIKKNVLSPSELNEITKEDSYFEQGSFKGARIFREAVLDEQMYQRALEMSLASQIHQRRHGAFPSSVDEIVAILAEEGIQPPVDPFSPTGGLLRYERTRDQLLFTSVGEQRKSFQLFDPFFKSRCLVMPYAVALLLNDISNRRPVDAVRP